MPHTVYASFWKRVVAFVIDNILAAIPASLICIPLLLWQGSAFSNAPQEEQALHVGAMFLIYILWQLLGAVSMWLYYAFLESSPRQATFGKQLMKIKVISKQGQRISFARASGRFFAKILSYLTLYVGFLMAGLTNRKRALHDYIAETYVVAADFEPGDELPDTPAHPIWLSVIAAVLFMGFLFFMVLGVIAQQPMGLALQAAAQLQAMAEQPDLGYGTFPVGGMIFSHQSDGYRASFEDADGGEYTLYLPQNGAAVCCEDYPGFSCEATGFEECE